MNMLLIVSLLREHGPLWQPCGIKNHICLISPLVINGYLISCCFSLLNLQRSLFLQPHKPVWLTLLQFLFRPPRWASRCDYWHSYQSGERLFLSLCCFRAVITTATGWVTGTSLPAAPSPYLWGARHRETLSQTHTRRHVTGGGCHGDLPEAHGNFWSDGHGWCGASKLLLPSNNNRRVVRRPEITQK